MNPRQLAILASICLAAIFSPVWAESITVTDVAGREVVVDAPVDRVILGEGRQIYLVGALDPDIILMNIEAKQATESAQYIEKLAAVGIPLVYVDFRENPLVNTEPSMRLIGQLFDKEEEAEAFIDYRNRQIKRVTDVIAAASPERPTVFIDRAGGLFRWEACVPGGSWVGVGPGADSGAALRKLEALTHRTAMTGIAAVENDQFHAIWHQFYNSPYQFVAIQQLAKWLHPDLFADLDPAATFAELHDRFLPVSYTPGYWASLSDAEH